MLPRSMLLTAALLLFLYFSPLLRSGVTWITWQLAAAIGALSILTYALPYLVVSILPPQNLKKKYDADWAFVTGSSSGIGRALAERLALQGVNIVLVALDDQLLKDTHAALTNQFPQLKFRAVGADLSVSDGSYMTAIAQATKDIHVSLVFNNAGYMVTGFFRQVPLNKHLANIECNTVSAVRITHHFFQRMVDSKRKGAIVFTSSVAGYIPSPFATGYGATKAFLSSFAASLAVEARHYGVDICAVHPSPVNSRFLDKADKLDSLEFTSQFAYRPEDLPDDIFRTVGRAVWRDLGGFALVARGVTKLIDYNALATIFSLTAHNMKDWKMATQRSGPKS
ncbi:17 beta-hydroxysteroid dehydrogenase type 3 [Klebsormidium nitens]|uniref:17 beta-hydroxysteroid dehydrogenase type 3 n=1 Tax=Klebsormidium nitens TaxID=105231 RepID=A0A1Y1HXE5_KLENI|nr:17 beta-hydroxysteroid dehydrogenase type 3 [Klebsormidium nitens]|eukprot:GAQ83330.1 17 beta-hydroxysteroid dehydrogenase type 3 [Klebsormidium nitens]